MEIRQLSDLLAVDRPQAVLQEVKTILLDGVFRDLDLSALESAFQSTIDLFEGRYPGYRACNTEYHDLRHTTDVFLTTARLIHGEFLLDEDIDPAGMAIALIAALLHDVGYIQETHDTEGTGAKYKATHIQRSMLFIQKNARDFGLGPQEMSACEAMVLCTDAAVTFERIDFPSKRLMLLGRTLGAADLIAQTADRTYLEKLLFLYHEFQECNMGGYRSEVDLLRKTVGFYDYFERRVHRLLRKNDEYLRAHFKARWQIPENLYRIAVDSQRSYLHKILDIPDADPTDYLKRGGIVGKIRRMIGRPDAPAT